MIGALNFGLWPQMTSDWPQILHAVWNWVLTSKYQISSNSERKKYSGLVWFVLIIKVDLPIPLYWNNQHLFFTVFELCEFSFGFMTPLFFPCPVLEQTMEESANQRRRNTCWQVFTWTRFFTQNFYCFNNPHLHIFAWKYEFLTHILPLKLGFIV